MIAKSTKNIHIERNNGTVSNSPQSDPSISTAEDISVSADDSVHNEDISVPVENISVPAEMNVPEEEVRVATTAAPLHYISTSPANPVASAPPSFETGDIVMVLKKTLHWSTKILTKNSNLLELMFYDKARTKEWKKLKYLVVYSKYTKVLLFTILPH